MLVQDITTFLDRFYKVIINHIFRQSNSAIDWLAKYGLSIHSINMWNLVPHRDLGHILIEYNLGRVLEKRAS